MFFGRFRELPIRKAAVHSKDPLHIIDRCVLPLCFTQNNPAFNLKPGMGFKFVILENTYTQPGWMVVS